MAVALGVAASGPSVALAQQQGAGADAGSAGDTVSVRPPPATPLGALGRSLILPGWGQARMGKSGRGVFYFLGGSAGAFMVVRSQLKLAAARRGLPADVDPADSDLVSSRKQQRENWIVLSVFWALLSGVDAWVTAHFWGYEGKVEPPSDGSAGIELRYEIPLGGG